MEGTPQMLPANHCNSINHCPEMGYDLVNTVFGTEGCRFEPYRVYFLKVN